MVISIFTICVSIIATIISIIGLIYSIQANKKSDKIQELQTRPWLHPFINTKCNPNGEFYSYHLYEDLKVGFAVSIGLENIGNSPASNIKVTADVFFEDTKFEVGAKPEEIFILSQDKTYYIKKIHIYDSPSKEMLEELGQKIEENKIGIKAKITISYNGLINSRIYGTEVCYLITKKEYRYDGLAKII